MVINPIVGEYIPIIRIPIKGGITIPNIATFDHGTYALCMVYLLRCPIIHQKLNGTESQRTSFSKSLELLMLLDTHGLGVRSMYL